MFFSVFWSKNFCVRTWSSYVPKHLKVLLFTYVHSQGNANGDQTVVRKNGFVFSSNFIQSLSILDKWILQLGPWGGYCVRLISACCVYFWNKNSFPLSLMACSWKVWLPSPTETGAGTVLNGHTCHRDNLYIFLWKVCLCYMYGKTVQIIIFCICTHWNLGQFFFS